MLNPKGERPKDVATMDWEGFFQFADEQGILGLMADDRWHTDLTDHTDFESHAEITKSKSLISDKRKAFSK